MIIGFLLCLLGAYFERLLLLVLPGCMSVMFGACCGAVAKWRSDRGLWMLATVLATGTVLFVALWTCGILGDLHWSSLNTMDMLVTLVAIMILFFQFVVLEVPHGTIGI